MQRGILLVIYLRAFTDAEPLKGQATTLVTVLFLGSVQLISLGIIGEYLGRIYNEVRGRPLYILRDTLGVVPRPADQSGYQPRREDRG